MLDEPEHEQLTPAATQISEAYRATSGRNDNKTKTEKREIHRAPQHHCKSQQSHQQSPKDQSRNAVPRQAARRARKDEKTKPAKQDEPMKN